MYQKNCRCFLKISEKRSQGFLYFSENAKIMAYKRLMGVKKILVEILTFKTR